MSAFVYLTPIGYSAVSRTHCTVRPVMVVVAAMRSTITWWLIKGRPRQFMVIWENSLCSILFHLLVPGGRWQTVTRRPVSAANFAISIFQALTLDPLEPPPSAQINNRSASGYRALPMVSHQLQSV